jgi:hypothetical protein
MNPADNKGCRFLNLPYSRHVKIGVTASILVSCSALLLLGTGCGGLYASPSLNPLMFFLPGMVQTKPAQPQAPLPGQTATNWTLAQAK